MRVLESSIPPPSRHDRRQSSNYRLRGSPGMPAKGSSPVPGLPTMVPGESCRGKCGGAGCVCGGVGTSGGVGAGDGGDDGGALNQS